MAIGFGCYDPPPLDGNKPLACTTTAVPDNDCPLAQGCVGGLCVKKTCAGPKDCPSNYICGRSGCGFPSLDGGMPQPGPDAGGID